MLGYLLSGSCWTIHRLVGICIGFFGMLVQPVGVSACEQIPIGNPDRGEQVYQRCAGCHSLEYNRTGPGHCGLIGRQAGSVPGFEYSEAMLQSGIVWSRETLDSFIAAPSLIVPGTTMTYAGIDREKDRLDLIAYLEEAGKSENVCGPTRGSRQP